MTWHRWWIVLALNGIYGWINLIDLSVPVFIANVIILIGLICSAFYLIGKDRA